MPVFQQVDVQLRAEAVFDRAVEGCHGIFRNVGLIVIAPVGVAVLPQQLPARMAPAAAQQQRPHLRQHQQYQQN